MPERRLPCKIDLSKEIKKVEETWGYCDTVEIQTDDKWIPWMKTKDFQDIIQTNLDAEGIKKSSAQVIVSTHPNTLLEAVKEIDRQKGESRNISAWRIKCETRKIKLIPKD